VKTIVLLAIASAILMIDQVDTARAKTPCEIGFSHYYGKYLIKKSVHYAIATTGGRPLASLATSCAMSSGRNSTATYIKMALAACKLEAKKNNHRGQCRVIKTR
jgi:hypothetical protein